MAVLPGVKAEYAAELLSLWRNIILVFSEQLIPGSLGGGTFVTRKITRAAARITLGLQDKLYLGNLDSRLTPVIFALQR